MPKLTNTNYVEIHDWLRAIWLEDIARFADVSQQDQLELHKFFCPDKNLAAEELVEHRRTVTAADSSLPHRAGRALRRFKQVLDGELEPVTVGVVVSGPGRRRRAISVRAVMRPEPDLQRLARALMSMSEEEFARLRRDMKQGKSGDERAA